MNANDNLIYTIALQNGFNDKSAKIIVAQARLESANYTSNVFKKNNNAFGMKFIGQKYATKGSPAPVNERVKNPNANVNFYAKYNNVGDSAKDLIERLLNITRNGVTPEMLKNTTSPEQYATLQKKRGYFGGKVEDYAKNLRSILKRITPETTFATLTPLLLIGLFFLGYKLTKGR
jgi:flagellum-specific peptidoglycan hydrolase FlgJ